MQVKLYAELETYPDPFSDKMDGHINWHKEPGEDRVEIILDQDRIFDITSEAGDYWWDFIEENGISDPDEDWSEDLHRKTVNEAFSKGILQEGVFQCMENETDNSDFYFDTYRMMLRRKFGDV